MSLKIKDMIGFDSKYLRISEIEMTNGVGLKLTEEMVSQISEGLEEPKWLLEIRLDALSALDRLEFPKVISTPGRVWTDLTDLDFENLIDPLTQKHEILRDEVKGVEILSFSDALKRMEILSKKTLGELSIRKKII